jgi:hypothetical protein
MLQQAQDAFVVTVIQAPAREATAADVILGALGLAGLLFLAALLLGLLAGVGLVVWHRIRPPEVDHLPSVSPTIGVTPSRSTPTR